MIQCTFTYQFQTHEAAVAHIQREIDNATAMNLRAHVNRIDQGWAVVIDLPINASMELAVRRDEPYIFGNLVTASLPDCETFLGAAATLAARTPGVAFTRGIAQNAPPRRVAPNAVPRRAGLGRFLLSGPMSLAMLGVWAYYVYKTPKKKRKPYYIGAAIGVPLGLAIFAYDKRRGAVAAA